MDISNPDSENYGKYRTPDEVVDMFAPELESVNAVTEWLAGFGIGPGHVSLSKSRGWLAFDATTKEVENLLHAEYHFYKHTSLGRTSPACESYHVPKHIQEHVDNIIPGIKLFAPTKRGSNLKRGFGKGGSPLRAIPGDFPGTAAGELSTCDKFVTPACIRALYKIPEILEYSEAGPRADNSMGIFEEAGFFSQSDLDLFLCQLYSPNSQGNAAYASFN